MQLTKPWVVYHKYNETNFSYKQKWLMFDYWYTLVLKYFFEFSNMSMGWSLIKEGRVGGGGGSKKI